MKLLIKTLACRAIPTSYFGHLFSLTNSFSILLLIFINLAIVITVFPLKVYAVCPVCTVAAGAGLGISRYFGIDDFITSIWIGGLIVSSSIWFTNYLKTKSFYNIYLAKFSKYVDGCCILFVYSLTIFPLYYLHYELIKIIKGSIVGVLTFVLGIFIDKQIRSQNGGKVAFFYQKVIIPITLLIIVSSVSYFLI